MSAGRSSGPSGKHRPVTGNELVAQRQQLVALASSLPYRLHPDEPPPLGALAALGRALGIRGDRIRDAWWGRRKLPVLPARKNISENS